MRSMTIPRLRPNILIALIVLLTCVPAFADTTPAHQSYVICIDPGHPSEVGTGTEGRHITEMRAAWEEARQLEKVLEARGMKVVLTKHSEKQLVRNRRRAEIANDAHADYMIRLHCDANAGSGIASYAPDGQGVSDGVRGPSAEVIAESQRMGKAFHTTMVKSLHGALPDRGFLPDTRTAVGRKHGALIGSIFSKVPVVLVEMCVLTNPHDEAFIRNPKNQKLLANAMADGIEAALAARRLAAPASTQ
jgi:N-acetylmuramoyl-L-alanine amidase